MPARDSDMGDREWVILAKPASILISSGVLRTAGLGVFVAGSLAQLVVIGSALAVGVF